LVGARARRVVSGTELGALPPSALIGCSLLVSRQKMHRDGVLGNSIKGIACWFFYDLEGSFLR
jgi:hypothetical protein